MDWIYKKDYLCKKTRNFKIKEFIIFDLSKEISRRIYLVLLNIDSFSYKQWIP